MTRAYQLSRQAAPYDRTAAEIAASVTPVDYGYPPGDVRRYGAVGDGSTNDRTALQNALSSNDEVVFPLVKTYKFTTALHLKSNQTITAVAGAEIILGSGVTTEYMLRGANVSNVTISGLKITGNGAAGLSSCYLTSCTDVLFDNCTITKAGSMAIYVSACSRVTVRSCDLSQNYFYAVEDRDGTGNSYIGNRCYSNGATGVASSSGGRGINLWRCVGNYVAGNRFASNTEYGFRLYSEAADVTQNYGNRIVGNHFQDNTSADLVLYDESLAGTLVKQNVVADNIAQRSTNPTLGVSFLLHGGDNTIANCHVYKSGTIGTFVAFNFYYALRNKVVNCSATNTADALGFSNATDCVVEGFLGKTVATVAGTGGFVGSGNTLSNSKFYHGGGGGSDVGIVHYNATGRNYIFNVELDAFSTGIYIGTEAVTIRDCKTTNSTTVGFRKDSDAQAGQEIIGNVWDSTNPALIQYLERRAAGTAVLYASAAPTIRTWAVGDICWNTGTAAAGVPGWVCTTAGTPGTWKAMAAVAA